MFPSANVCDAYFWFVVCFDCRPWCSVEYPTKKICQIWTHIQLTQKLHMDGAPSQIGLVGVVTDVNIQSYWALACLCAGKHFSGNTIYLNGNWLNSISCTKYLATYVIRLSIEMSKIIVLYDGF